MPIYWSHSSGFSDLRDVWVRRELKGPWDTPDPEVLECRDHFLFSVHQSAEVLHRNKRREVVLNRIILRDVELPGEAADSYVANHSGLDDGMEIVSATDVL